jgi:hypothetical protein
MSALLLSLVLSQISYSPAEAQAIFAEGVEAYGRDDPAAAEAAFRKLLEQGMGGSDVAYNLGTADLAQGKLGEAVLYLERARRQGGGPDVEANLSIARGRVVDQVVGGSTEEGIVARLVAATSSSGAAVAFLIPWCVGFGLIVFARLRGQGPSVGVAAVLLVVLALPGAGLLLAHYVVAETVHDAVVMAKTLPVHETPDTASKVAFELHAGSGVRLLAASGPFVHVRLPNGLEGWAEGRDVVRVEDTAVP